MIMIRTWIKNVCLKCCFALIRCLDKKALEIVYRPQDVIWCKMPLTKDKLMNVEPGHRIRPYVVYKIEETSILAFMCSSSSHYNVAIQRQYIIEKDKYGLNKDSYVNAATLYRIPIENIKEYFFHLDDEDYEQLLLCQNATIKNRQEIIQQIGIGSIVEYKENYIYIYGCDQGLFYVSPLVKTQNDLSFLFPIAISCHKTVYYLDYGIKQQIPYTEEQFMIRHHQLSKKECKQIKRKQKEFHEAYKRVEKQKLILKEIKFIYNIGSAFMLPNGDFFVYLYTFKENAYGFYMDEEGYCEEKIRKDSLQEVKFYSDCDVDYIKDLISILIDKYKDENTQCSILSYVLSML